LYYKVTNREQRAVIDWLNMEKLEMNKFSISIYDIAAKLVIPFDSGRMI